VTRVRGNPSVVHWKDRRDVAPEQTRFEPRTRHSSSIAYRSNKYKFIQIKPQAPKLNALIKLHKVNLPIRPVVNYKNAPTYHIAKFLAKWLKQNMDLPYKYNIDSTIHCAEALKK
jgi:hypothetical protein